MRRNTRFTDDQVWMARVHHESAQFSQADDRTNTSVNYLIGQIANKWAIFIVEVLAEHGALRFTRISWRVKGISQRMLAQTLRQLQREGIVTRTVHSLSLPKVEYELTDLCRSLGAALSFVRVWAVESFEDVERARVKYDEEQVLSR